MLRSGWWKRLLFVGILAGSVAGGRAANAQETEKNWSLTLQSDFYGKYVWRGINVVDDPVWQPSLTFSYAGFSANVWGNLDLTEQNSEKGQFTEVDLTVSYAWAWKDLNFSVGAINYQFPNPVAATTTEVYATVGLATLLSPTLKVYHDIDEVDGTYVALAMAHEFTDVMKLGDGVTVSVDASGSVGYGSANYNRFYYGSRSAALTDALVSIGMPVRIGARWTIRPSANCSTLLDGSIAGESNKDTNVWFGLSLVGSF